MKPRDPKPRADSSPVKVPVALIGCGAIAIGGHLPALLRHPGFDLRVVCDIDRERALRAAHLAGGIEVTTDWTSLVNRSDIAAFVLALHPEHGLPVALTSLRKNKHVLDEKPFAADLRSGRRLLDAARHAHATYQAGFCFREADLIVACRERLLQLGRPHVVRFEIFDELWDPEDSAHLNMIQGILARSSAITHEGSHFVDIYRSWNPGIPSCCKAVCQTTDAAFQGPNIWLAEAVYPDHCLLQLQVGWLLNPLPPSRIFCSGPEGWFEVNPASGRGNLVTRKGRNSLHLPPLTQNWDRQLDRFHAACTGKGFQGPSAEDGYEVLKTTIAWERNA